TPIDMFHKIMMRSDSITPHALELCSTLSMDEINDIRERMESGELSGLDAKLFLAKQIVTDLHGEAAAEQAEEQYATLTSRDGEIDLEPLESFSAREGQSIVEILRESGLAPSNSEARRLLKSNGVRVNGITVDESWTFSPVEKEFPILQVGKK